MGKSALFISLYSLAGLTGWGAYELITNEDTSITSIVSFAQTTNEKVLKNFSEEDNNIYRYKNENDQWVYSNVPYQPDLGNNLKKELEYLSSLPPEALPTRDVEFTKSEPESVLPFGMGKEPVKVHRLMEEAKRLAGLMKDKNEILDEISSLADKSNK